MQTEPVIAKVGNSYYVCVSMDYVSRMHFGNVFRMLNKAERLIEYYPESTHFMRNSSELTQAREPRQLCGAPYMKEEPNPGDPIRCCRDRRMG